MKSNQLVKIELQRIAHIEAATPSTLQTTVLAMLAFVSCWNYVYILLINEIMRAPFVLF